LVGENLKKTQEAEGRVISKIQSILSTQSDDVAAIILEPIQGEGGDNHFTPDFWKKLRKLADEHEVMLIADEVQSGMGLTGKWWAFQHYGVVPDIVCFGKKSQVCGIMATNRVDSVKDNVFKLPSRINSTWGGNLIDMVRCTRFLEVIEEDNLVNNAATVGEYFLEKLKKLQEKYPQSLTNIRGKGLMIAFDCFSGDYSSKVVGTAYQKQLIILTCGTQTVRFRPPLDITKKNVDDITSILDSVFKELGPDKPTAKL